MTPKVSKSKFFQGILIIILSIPLIYYYYQTWLHAVNIPYSDDYVTALTFLNDFTEGNISDKIKILFSQHAEHRVVLTRSVALFTYSILGEVNFSACILFGNFGLLLLGFLFYKQLPQEGNKLFYALPIVFFLFNLQNWGCTASSYNSIQHFYALFFVFTSLYLLNRGGYRFLLIAIITAILATFTSGNGLLVFPIGLTLLLFQKRYGYEIIVWISVAIAVLSLYFYGYSSPSEGNLENLLRQPDKVIASLYAGVGGFINFERDFDPVSIKSYGFLSAMFTGVAISIFFIYLIFIKYYRTNPFLFCCLLFLFLTYAAISFSRSQFATVENISSVSRYKINSIVLILFIYLILIEILKNKYKNTVLTCMILLSAFHNLHSSQIDIHSLNNLTLNKIKGSWIWKNYHSNEELWFIKDQGSDILTKAEKKGIFKMPDYTGYYLKNSELVELDLIEETNSIQFSFEIDNKPDNDYITIFDGWAFIKDESSRGNKIYLVLKDESDTLIFKALNSYRQDVTAYFKEETGEYINLSHSGFTCVIDKKQLKPAVYQVGLLITKKGKSTALQYTDKVIDLTDPGE